MQRMWPLHGSLSSQGPPPCGTPEPLRVPSGRIPRLGLHRVRHLLLRVPRTRRHSRAPEGVVTKQLTKGNEAVVKAAILAGCRAFYGYPIPPASEITEAAALYLPQAGGVFVQAESEVSAINMLYGGAAAGVRSM